MSDTTSSGHNSRHRLVGLCIVAAAVVLAAVLAAAFWNRDAARACRLAEVVSAGDAEGFNLLLVTLDTTRADRLGCYGYEKARTPAIDSLVNHGVRFDDAVTSVPITLPSHATMLTGLYPPNHGARDNGVHHVVDEHVTLAETLAAHGYDTAAIIAAFVLDERFGLAQGFQYYEFEVQQTEEGPGTAIADRPADDITDAALRWLAGRDKLAAKPPFFLWVHYFDPHRPYTPPAEHRRMSENRPYDAEIAFMDAEFQRLLDGLDERGLRERTLIAVASDHGEGLGDHGEVTHGILTYESTMRAALILSCPALFDRAYRDSERVVGLVDLRPTLEDLLGIPLTQPCDGQSLLRAESDPDRAIYIETLLPTHRGGWSALYGLRRHRDKYVLAPQSEYFDLLEDPEELDNLHASNPPALAPLSQQLAELMERWGAGDEIRSAQRTMTPDEIERLAALGYVGDDETPASGEERADPKLMIAMTGRIMRVRALCLKGNYQEALPLVSEVVEQCPDYALAYRLLAKTYVGLGRTDEAAALLREYTLRRPDFDVYLALAKILLEMKRYDELEEVLHRAQSLRPKDGAIPVIRGSALARQGRLDEAIAEYERALELDETRYGNLVRKTIDELKESRAATDKP